MNVVKNSKKNRHRNRACEWGLTKVVRVNGVEWNKFMINFLGVKV